MRLNEEGSYFPPTDVMNDIFKLMENIIAETGIADCFYFGIDCNGNNFYSQETNTYEMDGFKKPLTSEEITDFYLKLCNEHPLLLYLEEPLAENDKDGWAKLTEKFDNEKPNITISKKVELYKVIEEPKLVLNENEEEKKEEDKKEEEKEENKEGEEKENEALNLPYNCVTYKLGDLKVITDMLRDIEEIKKDNENMKVNLWEYDHESEQTSIIDIGFGIRADNIILNGFTMDKQKLLKLNKFIELINDLYENTPVDEEEEEENAEVNNENEYQEEENKE